MTLIEIDSNNDLKAINSDLVKYFLRIQIDLWYTHILLLYFLYSILGHITYTIMDL